ncbi:MAG: DUF5652 family protein [Candidatus Paceibacterota bacterium]
MENINDSTLVTLLAIVVVTLPFKGTALWMAARRSHMRWFIVLLIVNSLAILEIIYIFFIAKQYTVEVEETNADSRHSSSDIEK